MTFDRERRITASAGVQPLTLYAGAITASAVSRTLAGPIVRFGVPGRTSRGMLKVAPGALRFPEDLNRVKLTLEHDRAQSRGHLVALEQSPDGIRASLKVSDGPLGDAALQEAVDKTRDGFSYDVIDSTIDGDTITDALVIAIGQVGIPAYDDMRIDTIAASTTTPGEVMTPEQRARLAALLAQETRTTEEETELAELQVLAEANPEPAAAAVPAAGVPVAVPAAGVPVAASVPAVPAGVPRPAVTTTPRAGSALRGIVRQITAALNPGGGGSQAITAALSDIVSTGITEDIEPFAWSGELWSGLQYVPEWTDLLASGNLTNWEGKGWRFTSKLAIADYAGDKAAIPSGTVTTEPSEYEAARMAVGVDIDRKFYDFPNEGFVNSLFEQVRESWEIQLDTKVRAWILSNAVAGTRPLSVTTANADATVEAANGSFTSADVGATITGTGIPGGTTILSVTDSGTIELSANATATGTVTATIGAQSPTVMKAAARASMILKRRRVGRANWIVVNDEDMFSLLDVAEKDVPAFLELWGVKPEDFRSSPDVPAGTVVAGVRQVGVLRTLPGSPIRVSAQNLANGGVDEAFFGYWAIEEHHTSGIVTVKYKAAA